jgi:hypothetical protein
MLRLKAASAGTAPAVPADAEVWRDYDGRVAAYGFTVDGHHWMRIPGIGSFSFSAGTEDVTSFPEPDVPPETVLDAYRRTVLPMALQALGWEVLHASAVRMDPGVVALCAVSQTGKSTVAYALGRRGHRIFADDAVPLDLSDAVPRAVPLPFALRLRPESISFFGSDGAVESSSADNVDEEPTPLSALCILERAGRSAPGGPVRIGALSPTASFPRVLTHAYCFSLASSERRGAMVERYLDVVSRVPVFEVRLWPGLENLSGVVDAIERAVERATG